jgi:hypothetical protein
MVCGLALCPVDTARLSWYWTARQSRQTSSMLQPFRHSCRTLERPSSGFADVYRFLFFGVQFVSPRTNRTELAFSSVIAFSIVKNYSLRMREHDDDTTLPTQMAFEPLNLKRHPEFVRFEDADGLEYEVYGGDSRLQVAFELAESIQAVLKQAERLLKEFMKHAGTFSAQFVQVLAAPDDDGAICRIRHTFIADADPNDFNYTYFDVFLAIHEPPSPRFWPIKFVVGFW